MAYNLYLCGERLPVPDAISLKVGNKNSTVNLLDGKTINILKSPGLTDVSFSISLPMLDVRNKPDFYIAKFARYKKKKKPTQFVWTRTAPDGKPLYDTNIRVSIEDYSVSESAENPFEVEVSLKLKQYEDYATETVELKKEGKQTVAKVKKERETENAPSAKTYKVKSGDSLHKIAAQYLGSPSKYKEIFEANKDKLYNPFVLKPGVELVIP